MKKYLSLFAALVSLAACNVVEIDVPAHKSIDLNAEVEQFDATKTVMDANNNIRWTEGDQIVAFMNSSLGLKYELLPAFAGKTSGSFTDVSEPNGNINAGMEWDHIVAYYPYSEYVTCEKEGDAYALVVYFPNVQEYAYESIPEDSFPMVAVSSNSNITFKNVGGAMKLSLKGNRRISYIMLQGNNSELISSQAKVTASVDAVPEVTMLEYATNYIFLGCWNEEGAGVQLNQDKATEFIISLPPVTFEKGFTLHVTDTNGATTQIKSDKLNTVLRSSILVMPEINVDEYEWVMPKTPIQLNTVLSAVSNVQIGTNSVTLNLATDGVSCYIDPNTFTYVYEGTGNYLALDLYSADGYLHEGVYYPSSTGGTINEGEFAIGWDPGDIYGIGYPFENWGTCWWNVGDSGATINRKITDGYVVVSRDGDNWKIELICGENESMLWVQYNGPIEQLTLTISH